MTRYTLEGDLLREHFGLVGPASMASRVLLVRCLTKVGGFADLVPNVRDTLGREFDTLGKELAVKHAGHTVTMDAALPARQVHS